jgi:hypothetical protein
VSSEPSPGHGSKGDERATARTTGNTDISGTGLEMRYLVAHACDGGELSGSDTEAVGAKARCCCFDPLYDPRYARAISPTRGENSLVPVEAGLCRNSLSDSHSILARARVISPAEGREFLGSGRRWREHRPKSHAKAGSVISTRPPRSAHVLWRTLSSGLRRR